MFCLQLNAYDMMLLISATLSCIAYSTADNDFELFLLYCVGLPSNFSHLDYKPPSEIPCIVHLLCQRHEGLDMEAKEIKEFWWKPYIKKLFDKKVSSAYGCIIIVLHS